MSTEVKDTVVSKKYQFLFFIISVHFFHSKAFALQWGEAASRIIIFLKDDSPVVNFRPQKEALKKTSNVIAAGKGHSITSWV